MGMGAPGLRWGVEQRLEFIEFRLFWEGGVNRSDITDYFGVSVPQASKDLSQYQALAPENIVYDRSEKRYFAAERFNPRFMQPDANRYLAQLTSIADRTSQREETWLSRPPELDTMPIPHRKVSIDVLRKVLAGIRSGRSVEILYQSMNRIRPDALWRRVSPHAFGSDGFRWHVRAYCHVDRKFKDFLLSRCLDARLSDEPSVDSMGDTQWRKFFDVVLSPNPKLSSNQRKIIAQDYDMSDGHLTVPVRRALLYYFRKRLRLDVADALDNPAEAPIVVTNRDAFDIALAEAMS
jgi:predicted DNA-binding transcriptional regulator YafY